MTIASALAACRSEVVHLVQSIIRVLQWIGLIFIVFVLFPGLLPKSWIAVIRQFFSIQTSITIGIIVLLLFTIYHFAKARKEGWKAWIGTCTGMIAGGIAAVFWVPQWSGYIVTIGFVLLVFAPGIFNRLALRCSCGGYEWAAALCARVAWLLHPSRSQRFQLSFLSARALGSTEEKIAGYRALASQSTPEQSAILNCWICITRGDWEGVLSQLRNSDARMSALKAFGIRALGELDRIDEMVASYASAESVLSVDNLRFSRLFVLAFSGRVDGVRRLLTRQLRFISSQDKAYWTLIASRAAGTQNDEARRVLASYASATDDEGFRRRAERLLETAMTAAVPALSVESRATIAAIEDALWKKKQYPR
jgi:hypothetical protein